MTQQSSSLPKEVALRTREMVFALSNDHWSDLTERQRELVSSLYFTDAHKITVGEAAAITEVYGSVVGVRV